MQGIGKAFKLTYIRANELRQPAALIASIEVPLRAPSDHVVLLVCCHMTAVHVKKKRQKTKRNMYEVYTIFRIISYSSRSTRS